MTQRTELGKTTLYTYDYDNRLTRVTSPQSQVASYAYDSLGRRTRKDDGRGTIMKYVYDGANIIAEYAASGALLKKNLFGPGVDEILSTIDYGLSTTYYYHKDALGSITDITSSSGSTVESYSYWIGG
jgi:YD repeat-containing protein